MKPWRCSLARAISGPATSKASAVILPVQEEFALQLRLQGIQDLAAAHVRGEIIAPAVAGAELGAQRTFVHLYKLGMVPLSAVLPVDVHGDGMGLVGPRLDCLFEDSSSILERWNCGYTSRPCPRSPGAAPAARPGRPAWFAGSFMEAGAFELIQK